MFLPRRLFADVVSAKLSSAHWKVVASLKALITALPRHGRQEARAHRVDKHVMSSGAIDPFRQSLIPELAGATMLARTVIVSSRPITAFPQRISTALVSFCNLSRWFLLAAVYTTPDTP